MTRLDEEAKFRYGYELKHYINVAPATLHPAQYAIKPLLRPTALLNDLAMQWESRYFHRIRAYQARQQIDLFEPDHPWRRKAQD